MSLPASDTLINVGGDITLASYSSNWTQFNAFNSSAFHVNASGCYCLSAAGGAAVVAYWNADPFPNDQSSAVHWQSSGGSSGLFAGPCVRISSGSGGSFYWWYIAGDGAHYALRRTLNGTQTEIIASTAHTFIGGDVLKLTVVGTLLSLYQNAILIDSFNDSSGGVSVGAAGFQAFASATSGSPTVANWTGASLGAVTVPVFYHRKSVLYFI